MPQVVKHIRSAVAGKVPTTAELDLGVVAINTNDGKVFIKKDDGTPSIVEVTTPAATTSTAGKVQLEDSTSSTSTTKAATPNSVKAAYDLANGKAAASHTHGNITNAGAIGSTANLPVITTTSGVLTTGSFGTGANTFCQGNDSRLSDTRTPIDGTVTNAKVASNAAIAGSKISPDFGAQTVTTTGIFSAPDGTEAAPSITNTGDTNTGILFPAADTVAITTAGVQKFAIDSADGNPTIANDYPTTRPTLDLNFAQTKRLDPRVTFSRSSSATYFDANGVLRTAATNVARFDHNPSTGESLGLLVEEARTNLLLRSEEFSNAYWSKSNSTVTADAITAPDGITTADKLVASATDTTHFIFRGIAVSAGTTTCSVYVKAAEISGFYLFVYDGSAYRDFAFDLSTGTKTIVAPGLSSSIERHANGWYRVSCTYVSTGATNAIYFFLYPNQTTFLGDGTSGLYIWGAQLEAGSFPTSYIPTTTATVTRSADVATISGASFTNWWNPSTGTFQANFRSTLSGTRPVLSVDDNTANNRMELYTSTSSQKFTVTTAGAAQADITAGTASSTAINRQSAAYGSNDFSTSLSGATAVTDTSGAVPVVSQLRIGADQAGNTRTSPIARLTYWPVRLSYSTLAAITR